MAHLNHEEYQSKVTAVVVLFILYDILGFCGNVLVLFIYGTRYPKTRFRLLVLALSVVDFTSCCTTVPLETVSTYLYFDPPSRGLCKAKNFFVQLTGLSAMYMLFVTAVYKYRQICTPFKKQLTQKFIIILCCSGIISSMICAIPAGILWDINNHTDIINNKTDHAKICEVHKRYHDTLVPQFYRHLLSAYDIFLLATIVLYIFVAKKTFAHYRMMKRNVNKAVQDVLNRSRSFTSKSSSSKLCSGGPAEPGKDVLNRSRSFTSKSSSTKLCSDGSTLEKTEPGQEVLNRSRSFTSNSSSSKLCSGGSTLEKTKPGSENEISENNVSAIKPSFEISYDSSSEIKATNDIPPGSNVTDDDKRRKTMTTLPQPDSTDSAPVLATTVARQPSQQRTIDIRKVLIMVIIAGTFSVTFLMALTFGYVFAIRGLDDYSSVDEYIALFSCYRFYFINYCLNPTVYFAFDRRFREEVIKLLTCISCRRK